MSGVKTQVDVAWEYFDSSSPLYGWADDNPGEYEKLMNYRSSDDKEPTGISTQFGLGLLALINAGKLGDGTYQGV